jgi:hypothetical protein
MFSAGRHKGIPMVITENLPTPTPTPQHPFRILLIGGAKGSGKTTIARALCRRHPLHFKIVALGDALARACAAASRLPVRVFTDPRSKDRFHSALGTTPRQFMIVIGQGARSRNPQVWAERVAAEIRRRMESDTLIGVARLLGRVPTFIVPDLRDPRDAAYLAGGSMQSLEFQVSESLLLVVFRSDRSLFLFSYSSLLLSTLVAS